MSGCSWNHSFTIHWGAGVIHRALAVGVSSPLHPESRKDRVKSSYRLHKHLAQAAQSLASSEPRPAKHNRAPLPQRCAMWLEPYNAGREKSVKISIHNLVCLDSRFELISFVDCCPIALRNSILTGGGSMTGVNDGASMPAARDRGSRPCSTRNSSMDAAVDARWPRTRNIRDQAGMQSRYATRRRFRAKACNFARPIRDADRLRRPLRSRILVPGGLPIDHAPNSQRVCVLQLVRKGAVRKSLITDQARETENSLAAY